MPTEYTQQEVLNAMVVGLSDYLDLARIGLRGRWNSLSQSEKWAAGRALVALSDVKKAPQTYFSRATTWNDWQSRAEKYKAEKDLPSIGHAYYMVQDPTGIVWNQVASAFAYNAEMGKKFYHFCRLIQKWEYARTSRSHAESGVAVLYGHDIVSAANHVHQVANIKKSNPIIRPIKEMLHSLQK
ncbi:MAG: hypothetical protein IJY99_03810 [Alphaproteobacteria bacterium]|nr:hypothetical protein [Alphaproteobacteria bacterium]